MDLTPEERQRIYEEEKIKEEARLAAQADSPQGKAAKTAETTKALSDLSNASCGCGCLLFAVVIILVLLSSK